MAHLLLLLSCAVVSGCRPATEPPQARQPPSPSAPAPAARETAPAMVVSDNYQPDRFQDPERAEKLKAGLLAVKQLIDEQVPKRGYVGFAYGVVVDGELVQKGAFGKAEEGAPIDEHTRFRMGSITKTFTSAAVLAMRDAGQLDLDVPAARYVPALAKLRYPTRDARPITLRHLLTHRSGLPFHTGFDTSDPTQQISRAQLTQELGSATLLHPPGKQYSYSSLGMSAAAMAVEHAAGKPLRQVLQDLLFTPLGMRDTAWEPDQIPKGALAAGHDGAGKRFERNGHWRMGATEGAAGLYSSVHDMARYIAFQLDAHPARNAPEPIMRRASIRASHRGQALIGMNAFAHDKELYGDKAGGGAGSNGLGWFVRQNCFFSQRVAHSGAMRGHYASVAFSPPHGVGVVLMTNSRTPTATLSFMAINSLVMTADLQPRVSAYHPQLPQLVKDALDLAHDWKESEYQRLFSSSFRQIEGSSWQKKIEQIRSAGGQCRFERVLRVTAYDDARFLFKCSEGLLSAGGGFAPKTTQFHAFHYANVERQELRTPRCR